jgi:membrane protein DedA with SNARE-associated domain
MLIAVGALAGMGKTNLAVAIAVALCASVLADVVWYSLGRRRG